MAFIEFRAADIRLYFMTHWEFVIGITIGLHIPRILINYDSL